MRSQLALRAPLPQRSTSSWRRRYADQLSALSGEVGALLAQGRLDPDDLEHNDFLWAVNDWIDARAPQA